MTGNNRLEYIHRVAHFMLNAQSKRTAEAFRAGLEKVIPEEWLRMFNEQELQVHFHLTSHQDILPQQWESAAKAACLVMQTAAHLIFPVTERWDVLDSR